MSFCCCCCSFRDLTVPLPWKEEKVLIYHHQDFLMAFFPSPNPGPIHALTLALMHTHTHTHTDSLPWACSSSLLSGIHSGGSRPSHEGLAINPKVWLRFPAITCHITPSLLAPAGLREGTMPNTAPETLPVWL